MPDKDVTLAVLQSAIGLAGLLLVFAGFLLSKTSSLPDKYAKAFKWLTVSTLLPFVSNLFLAYMSILTLQGSKWAGDYLLAGLEISLGLTALVGIVGLISSL